MATIIRTLMLFIGDGSYPVIPAEWRGMQEVVDREKWHPIDKTSDNEVHVLNLDRLGCVNHPSRDPEADGAYMLQGFLRNNEWKDRGPEILVAGQTPIADRCVHTVHQLAGHHHIAPPFITVRFSMYYGQGGAPYPGETTDPAEIYNLDCPKDYVALWDFLGNPEVIAAVADEDHQALTAAVSSFNATRSVPILTFTALNEPASLVSE